MHIKIYNINTIYKLLFDYFHVQTYEENVLAIIYCWAVFKYGLSTNVNYQEADRYYRMLYKKYPISEHELIVIGNEIFWQKTKKFNFRYFCWAFFQIVFLLFMIIPFHYFA